MDVKLSYGVRDGHIVHISEMMPADKGEKCNCTCPVCNGILLARLGDKRKRHFAHKASCNCDIVKAQQTGLHLLAKDIIRENCRILVPGLTISRQEITSSATNFAATVEVDIDLPDIKAFSLQYNSVEIEKSFGDIIADANIKKDEINIIIEIAVTHFVDEIKANKMKALGLTCFEIDLSNLLESPQSRESIKESVLSDEANRYWIYNPKKERLLKEKRDEFQKKYAAIVQKQELAEKRKQEYRNKNILKLQKLMKPDNYANELKRLRNDKNATWWLTKFDFSIGLSEYPFYMDIPITGEFVFPCDRRIWQGKLFDDYVFRGYDISISKVQKRISNGTTIIHYDKQKTYHTTISINGQEQEISFSIDVVRRYFEYLDLLGFVDHVGYEWSSKRPVSLVPPNHAAANVLKAIIETVDPFCPHINQIIKDELLTRLDKNDINKVLKWDTECY